MEPQLTEFSEETWQKMKELVHVYTQKVTQLEPVLFNIQKHKGLPHDKQKEMAEIHETVKKYIHNLKILEDEYKQAGKLTELEKLAIVEASENTIGDLYDFLETASPKFKL